MKKIESIPWLFIKRIIPFTSREFRRRVIEEIITLERNSPPKEAAKWLLGVHDFVGLEIDHASIRWGNGLHIKHELMDGIHSFFYERIPENSKVLDLGCGIGVVADSIANHANATVLGIDMNVDAISFAEKQFQHPRLRFVLGNVFTDIPQSEKFDIVVLSSILEHLENRSEFLKSLSLKFNPQKILIRVPTFEQHYFKALKRELGLFAYVDPTHVLEYSRDVFMSEMEQANLKVTYFEVRWGDIWAECIPNEPGREQ